MARKANTKRATQSQKPARRLNVLKPEVNYTPSTNSAANSFSLDDLRAVKRLLSRFDGEQLKSLIDLVAR